MTEKRVTVFLTFNTQIIKSLLYTLYKKNIGKQNQKKSQNN